MSEADNIVNRALQRTVDQQMAIWETQKMLVEEIRINYETLPVPRQDAILDDLKESLLEDKSFFDTRFKNERFGDNRGIHHAIKSHKMDEHLKKALEWVSNKDDPMFYNLLKGQLPSFAAEPTAFAEIGGQGYYGSANPTTLTTLLFSLWFTIPEIEPGGMAHHTANEVSSRCGVLQKTNLPSDYGSLGKENRWVIQGNPDKKIPDIVAIPHSGFAYGGHRLFPVVHNFDLDVYASLTSPHFSPEDASSFWFNLLPPQMMAPYKNMVSPNTAGMQYGYRGHLLLDTNFRFRHLVDAGGFNHQSLANDNDLTPAFFRDCFTHAFDPLPGDLVIINYYKDTTSPEEEVIYRMAPASGHCGIFYQSNQFVAANRDIPKQEGLGLQRIDLNAADPRRRQVSFLRQNPKYNNPVAKVLSFDECYERSRNHFQLERKSGNGEYFAIIDLTVQHPGPVVRDAEYASQHLPSRAFAKLKHNERTALSDCSFRATLQFSPSGQPPPSNAAENGISTEFSENSTFVEAPKNELDQRGLPRPIVVNGQTHIFDTHSLGSGAKANVLRAQTSQSVMRAVKIVELGNHDDVVRFQKEVKLLEKCSHPNIVSYHGSVVDEQTQRGYIVLGYVEQTLRRRLDTCGAIQSADMVPIFRQILRALKYLHGKGFIHRDIKPQNVMLTSDATVKLIDFNIAAKADAQNLFECTLPYLAPEIASGTTGASEKQDSWSVGIMAIEVRTGLLPPYYRAFEKKKQGCVDLMLPAIREATYEKLTTGIKVPLEPVLAEFVQRCLEVDPGIRARCADLLNHPFLAEINQ